jgi:colicin import membrane protein
MDAATNRLEFAPPPTPGVLRSFGLAMLAHAFLLAALTWGVQWKRETARVSAEAELWSSVPQQAAPRLVELPPEPPALAPTPPAPPQVQPLPPDPNIALERDRLRLKKEQEAQRLEQKQQEKLKQEKLLLEKKRLQAQHEQERKAAEEKKRSEQEAQHKEAAKQSELQRQANLKRMAGLAGASGAPTSPGTALHSSGPSTSYAGRIRASIRPNIVFADDVAGNPKAEVEVATAPDGTIVSRKLTHASGVKSWDEAVLRAIDKTERLPRDVDGRVISPLVISFTPKD